MARLKFGSAFFLLLAIVAGLATLEAAAPPAKKVRRANRLAKESSPYLIQHAHNPVDWYPWGPEAFAKAKKDGKLVFLSIGYSACHWCHVMEKESFANAEVAKMLNKNFVCIKVDREERPDIDQIYMAAHDVLRKQGGGWPLSLFLTADGKPIFAGTYWPPEDRDLDGEKVIGFKSVAKLILKVQKDKPEELKVMADAVAKATASALAGATRGFALVTLDRKLVEEVTEALGEEFDRKHGGFGNPRRKFKGTKFPTPPRLRFLQGEAVRAKSTEAAEMVAITLDQMAQGGIYDHLGGGFHRYSTERTWTVPHFEKMLYDNAQLLELYGTAYAKTKKPAHGRVLRQTIDFVKRELTSANGAFYSALDADSEGEEGRFYVWTGKELDNVLKDKAENRLFKLAYGSADAPNFEAKYHILKLPRSLKELAAERKTTEAQLEAKLAPLRAKLLAARAKRPRPLLDAKVLTAWNGQMIAGLAKAGDALGDKNAIAAAEKAAEFVLTKLRTKDGRLKRSFAAAPGEKPRARFNAYLDDYAYLVHGFLNLHDVTKDKRWLTEAKTLTETMIKFHGDDRLGGFYFTSSDHEKFFARSKDQYDGAQPCGNSVAASNLVRLWEKTGEARYGTLAGKTFKAFAAPLKLAPTGLTGMADALGAFLELKAKKK
jgi:uncharacterized protein YyaL (SSP411 family)